LSVSIRTSTRDDARAIAKLSSEFSGYLRSLGDPNPGDFTEQQYLADAFGPDKAFSGLIAELSGEPVGYLLHCPGYDFDLGGRIRWVIDLFVTRAARGRGAGRALMRAAAEICRASGGGQLVWTLYTPNEVGRRFYEELGAKYVQDLESMHIGISDF